MKKMKAMIFAAGLGTRLKPVTDQLPKALVQVGGKTLLQHVIEKLVKAGFIEIVINVHHFPDKIVDFLVKNRNFGITIHLSDESDALLDTGGGLLKAAEWLKGDEPFLIHNVDVISDLDLKLLFDFHVKENRLATLVVRNRPTNRYLLFNDKLRLIGWTDKSTGEIKQAVSFREEDALPLAFSGIQIINPEIFNLIRGRGKFSIIDAYLDLAGDYPVYGFQDDTSCWMDVGKAGQLKEAEKMMDKFGIIKRN
jgi:NDP-sugar pyrophosphorylase family protein